MIAILGGLGAALLWASATLTSSRAGRLIGPTATVAWMMLVGVSVATPLAILSGPAPALSPGLTGWMAGSGAGGVAGLLLVYRGLRLGKVGVVASLASTEGAIAAVISVVSGEPMTLTVALTLCAIAGGVALVAFATEPSEPPAAAADATATADATAAADPPAPIDETAGGLPEALRPGVADAQKAVLFGATAALCFGLSIYSTARLGAEMSPLMAVLPVRVVGFATVFLPLALTRRLRLTRRALPMVVWIGVAEVFGNAVYVVGAKQSIAIAAVLASQFAAVAAIAAFVLFRERLSTGQRSGVVAIACGVAVLALVRA
jgi:drug/metabolite transporter (DMT)-like permease